jgi:hypothetical protein
VKFLQLGVDSLACVEHPCGVPEAQVEDVAVRQSALAFDERQVEVREDLAREAPDDLLDGFLEQAHLPLTKVDDPGVRRVGHAGSADHIVIEVGRVMPPEAGIPRR